MRRFITTLLAFLILGAPSTTAGTMVSADDGKPPIVGTDPYPCC